MRVRLLTVLTGTRDGVPWPPRGGEIDVPDAEGADLCAVGFAEPVAVDPIERAVAPAPERRAAPRKRKSPTIAEE